MLTYREKNILKIKKINETRIQWSKKTLHGVAEKFLIQPTSQNLAKHQNFGGRA